jgi:hypothetical protein
MRHASFLLATAIVLGPLGAHANPTLRERAAQLQHQAAAVGHTLTAPVRWAKDRLQAHRDWKETRRYLAGQIWARGGGDGSVTRTLGQLVGIGKPDPAVAAYTRQAPLGGTLKRMFPFATSRLANRRATLAYLKVVAAEPGAQLPAGVQRFIARQEAREAKALARERARLDLRATALGLGQ